MPAAVCVAQPMGEVRSEQVAVRSEPEEVRREELIGRSNGEESQTNGNGSLGDPSMFMFRGTANADGAENRASPSQDFNFESLNNLASSLNGWDDLAGLE